MMRDADTAGEHPESGMALPVVLWGIAAAALLVSVLNVSVRSGANFMAAEIELTQADALADAGLEIAVAHLLPEDPAHRWVANGLPHRVAFGGTELTIAVDDANGLVDVNRASRELLVGFLTSAMNDAEKAESLAEHLQELRQDAPNKANLAPENASNQTNRNAALPTPTLVKLGILDISELRRVDGMTPDLYSAIAPYLTTSSRDGRINPHTAPRAVLAALPGLTEMDIDRFFETERNDPKAAKDGLPQGLSKAAPFLSRDTGPAFIISVEIAKPGRPVLTARQFVAVLGVDAAAPYRLLSNKPINSLNQRWGAAQ